MANTIRIKRSAVPGKIPLTSDLVLGELAINTYDGVLYIKQDTTSTGGTESITTIGKFGYTGSQGYTGSAGYTGSRGATGFTGSQGVQGVQGVIGYTGSQGVAGAAGFTGSQGFTGSKGDIGFTGSQGVIGYTGSQGSQGFQGLTGYTGSQGEIGFTGSQGAIGFTGSRGYTGSQGTTGFTGSKGDIGLTGYSGSQGIQGVTGYTGSKGDIGYTGSVGPIGGANTQVLFNDSGVTAGDSDLTWDKTNNFLTVIGSLGINVASPIAKLDILDTALAGSGSLAGSLINLAQTWNTTGIPTAIKLNVTDTASSASSLLMDLQVDGVSKVQITKTGSINTESGRIAVGLSTSYSGFYRNGNNLLFATAGQEKLNISTGAGATFLQNMAFGASLYSPDLYLYRDAANILAQRNGVNPQTLRVYNTYTDASNYERGIFDWVSNANTLTLGTESAGTGTRRELRLNYTTTIDGASRTNIPALKIVNVGAGTGGILLGALAIGNQQDNTRITAFYTANKALGYAHAGVGVSGQGIHRFSTDSNGGTSSGSSGSIVDILAPATATNIFQCRQSDETNVFNVSYTGAVRLSNALTLSIEATTVASTTQTQVASFTAASFRSAKLIVQAFDSVTSEVQISELLVAHNGTAAFVTEYGVVFTGASALATFDVDINTGNVRLLATRATANSTQYKVSETLISA